MFAGLPVLLALLSYLAAPPTAASAAAGRPDRSFGQGSLFAARFGPSFVASAFTSVEATPGDGLVMWQTGSESRTGFQRYSPEGSLQPETTSPGLQPLRAVQADGKTVEVEVAVAEGKEMIRRRLPDGHLDPSFGNGGQEPLPYFSESSPHRAFAQRLVTLPSGKLVVAGTALFREEVGARTTKREHEVAVLRLAEDGKPDTAFGSGGVVKTRTDLGIAGGNSEEELRGIAARQIETLVVGVQGDGENEGSLIGLTAAGALDKAFGSNGTEPVKGDIEDVHSNAAGKILVAGTSTGRQGIASVGSDFFVSRFDEVGQPDPSFGVELGTTVIDFGATDTLRAVLWEPDGSALLGGGSVGTGPICTALGLCDETPVLARVDASGQLDTGFGSAGEVRFERLVEPARGFQGAGVLALAARPAGGAYAAGASGTTAFVAAVDPTGNPVAGFGEDGVLRAVYPHSSPPSSAADDGGRSPPARRAPRPRLRQRRCGVPSGCFEQRRPGPGPRARRDTRRRNRTERTPDDCGNSTLPKQR